MSNICLSIPRESSYNLPPIPSSHLNFDGVYAGPDPTPHLWPPGPRDKASGAIRSVTAGFGHGLDRGALRRLDDSPSWEMLEFGPVWLPWRPYDPNMWLAACAFNRYGVGWSYGPAHNLHDEAYGKYTELCGVAPEPIQKLDIDYSLVLYRQLDSEWRARFSAGEQPTQPIDPVPMNPQPQESSKEPSVPSTSEPSLIDIHDEIKGSRMDLNSLKEHISGRIDALIDDLGQLHSSTNSVLLDERQWWHDRISQLANEWSAKRPQLANQLKSLLDER